ncbi:uncharacterized protein LOC144885721 [Branchiostoma floridae x Branchiostoma japonicum]
MDKNVYEEACMAYKSTSSDDDYNEACTVSPSSLSATESFNFAEEMSSITVTTEISEQPETSTDDDNATTDYIPGVGMRNPGQSRARTSTGKKTSSALSLVLICCLLGTVIYLGECCCSVIGG